MRILWVGKGSASGGGGEDVYDNKLLVRLERDHEIVRFVPVPVGRAAKLANLARGLPLYRATYYSDSNVTALRSAVKAHRPDVVAISWEPFDFFAEAVNLPCVLILHNVTSDAVAEVFAHHPLAQAYARYVQRYERRLYSRPNIAGIVAISNRDAGIVGQILGAKPVTIVVPGAPPPARPPAPQLIADLLVSGSYDWYPKRRDLASSIRLLASARGAGLRLVWDHPLPEPISAQMVGEAVNPALWSPAIRYGLVPDRFASGFKLKVTYYLLNNCIVLSRSAVEDDYQDIPDYKLFLRRFDTSDDLIRIVAEIKSLDHVMLAERFERFKQECLRKLSWDEGAARLATVLTTAAKCGRNQY